MSDRIKEIVERRSFDKLSSGLTPYVLIKVDGEYTMLVPTSIEFMPGLVQAMPRIAKFEDSSFELAHGLSQADEIITDEPGISDALLDIVKNKSAYRLITGKSIRSRLLIL